MAELLNNLVNSVDSYLLQILVNIFIGIIFALGLNLITGITGQLSLGHAAFIGIGAFASAIISIKYPEIPFIVNLIMAAVISTLFGIFIGFPILRLSGDYLAIATLGFAEIIKVIFLNLDITNKALGLSVPPPTTDYPLPIIVFFITVLTIMFMSFIHNSRFGRALKAIREDEIAAEAMGVNVSRYKVQAFAIGAFVAGIGGGLYAHFITYINPVDFNFGMSVNVLCMTVLGGLGSIPGAILGSTILSIAPEFLRFMDQYRMLVYGGLLVFMMIFRPNGLLGGVDFRKLVKKIFIKNTKNNSKTDPKTTGTNL